MRFNLISNNLINIFIIAVIGITSHYIPLPFFILLIILWLIWLIYSNYMFIFKSKDIIDEMKRYDKKHLFGRQITIFSDAIKSTALKKEMFDNYADTENISQSYALIVKQVNSNAESALSFIKNYDYYSNASQNYINSLASETRELIGKLNDLSDMLIQIENDVHDVDITYVDDMLASLRRLSNDEQQQR